MKEYGVRRGIEYLIDNSYYNKNVVYPYRGYEAMNYLLDNFRFDTVLDIGCGEGTHSDIFLNAGKEVTAIDYGKSYYFNKMKSNPVFTCITSDFMEYHFDKTFDCVWCSHVLEHQLNPHDFLKKAIRLVKLGGVLAITVPPYRPTIMGGHVNLFNAGLLLYRLVLAGIDCSNAHTKTYDYDISVIVEKKEPINVLNQLSYDLGDLRVIKKYLPANLEFLSNNDDDPFYGNIRELNW